MLQVDHLSWHNPIIHTYSQTHTQSFPQMGCNLCSPPSCRLSPVDWGSHCQLSTQGGGPWGRVHGGARGPAEAPHGLYLGAWGMKWSRFNLLSPAGECRVRPLTDRAIGVVVVVAMGVWKGAAAPQSLLVNEISAAAEGDGYYFNFSEALRICPPLLLLIYITLPLSLDSVSMRFGFATSTILMLEICLFVLSRDACIHIQELQYYWGIFLTWNLLN